MKKILRVILTFLTIFSIIYAQNSNWRLIVPKDQVKVNIMAEGSNELFPNSQVENIIKLQLRRNDIDYIKNENIPPNYPSLYVNINAAKLKNGDVFGSISIEFSRDGLYALTIDEIFDESFQVKDLEKEDWKGPFYGATTWRSGKIFFNPSRLNYKSYLKEIIIDQVDKFSALYIDANNL